MLERFELAQLEEGREERELAARDRRAGARRASGAGMSDNWNYVAAGYTITAVTLVTYAVWIRLRIRRVRRALSDENRD